MAIAWIATRTEPQLIGAFRAVHWEIKVFAPVEFAQASPSRLKAVNVIVFEVSDGSLLDICKETCHKVTTPKLAMVADLAYAQAALEAGVDDFLVAPFNPIEALLRVRKLARSLHVVRTGDLEIDLAAWRVSHGGDRVQLSPLEFSLLACLAKRVGQKASHTAILDEVWEEEHATVDRLKNCVGRVRRKIEPDWHDPQYIITIPGGGYRLRNHMQWKANRRIIGT